MNGLMRAYQSLFAEQVKTLPGHHALPVVADRQAAMERFMRVGLPTRKLESWKYSAGEALSHRVYRLPSPRCSGLDVEDLDPYLAGKATAHRMVFMNGLFSQHLSDLQDLPTGLRVESLAKVAADAPAELEPYLGHGLAGQDQGFAELNHALWSDGAFVCVSPGSRPPKPLHLLFLTTASREPMMTVPWNLVILGRDADVLLLESHATLGEALHFSNVYTTLILGDHAQMRHVLLLETSRSAHYVGSIQATQRAGSRFDSHLLSVGGEITRQEVHVALAGEEAECALDGLFLAGGCQQMDFYTTVHHTHSSTRSRQLYKGVLDGASRGVFNGMVHVPPGVHNTQSRQLTANLLLSDTAEIDARPQLEINADAVQCSHGATVGSLDPDALFYLQSRGLDVAMARSLLVQGFADELLQRIEPFPLQEWVGLRLDLEGAQR
ncbi:MAG: Fe-S cluster assembly protein SufD [Magnetococcus sp. MYC-9]